MKSVRLHSSRGMGLRPNSILVRRARKGYSLVEIMVAVVLFSMVLGAGLGSVLLIARMSEHVSTNADYSHRARVLYDRVGQDARMARGFTMPDNQTLRMHGLPGGVVEYRSDQSGNLVREDSSGTRVLLNHVDSLLVSLPSADEMRMDLTLSRTLGRGPAAERELVLQFRKRN